MQRSSCSPPRMRFRGFLSASALGLLSLAVAIPAAAQQGTITGRVVDQETGTPLSAVAVQVVGTLGAQVSGGATNAQGQFNLVVAPGNYAVVVSGIGYETSRRDAVRVVAGETVVLELTMRSRALALNPILVTPSFSQSTAVGAPASAFSIELEEVKARPTASPLDHLRTLPGVDIATHGVQSGSIVARGFNNIFSGALLMLSDHRIASVPSLRVNLAHLVPANNDDIERIEVLLGPAAALYGPNTANGVVHFFSKSPLRYQETAMTVAGGEQGLFQGTFRTSHLLTDNFGVKVSGQMLRADEWQFVDPVEARSRAQALPLDPATRIGARDYQVERWNVDVRADYRIDDRTEAVFQVGRSKQPNGIELTGVGAAQIQGWHYTFYQARLTRDRLFVQAYMNASNSEDTYTLRDGAGIVDRSKLFVAQARHGFAMGASQNFTYGADYIRTMPDTDGTIHGKYEADDLITELGAFLQSETKLTSQLNLVLAGRMDQHSALPDAVFSPRAALIFQPVPTQSVRFTYNTAFSTPSANNLFLDINGGAFPDAALAGLGYGLRAQGTGANGFSFRRSDGSLTGMRSPFNPGGRNQLLPANVATMWQLAVGVLQAQGAIPAQVATILLNSTPNESQVRRMYLDVLSQQGQQVLTPESNFDVAPIRESNTTTFEIGYKGVLGDRLLLAADVWHSQRDNFVSALRPSAPLLFLNGQDIAAHLTPILGAPTAAALAQGMAQIPLGVVSSEDVSNSATRSDFLVTYRNFGELSLTGVDFSARYIVSDRLSLATTASFVDKDVFETEGQKIALNAPTRKLSASAAWKDDVRGFNTELRVRHNNAFPVLSAPYVATACLGETGPLVEPCIDAFTLVDVTAGYALSLVRGASVQLSISNLFDAGYRSFAGVPEVGRMGMLRLRYEF